MIISERTLTELNGIVKTALGLSNDAIITKATKFVRFDWRSLIEYFQKNSIGLKPPYVVIRPGPLESTDWGMHNDCWFFPIEIFLIDDPLNRIDTTVSGEAKISPDDVQVETTVNMFVGQRLFFVSSQQYRFVKTIESTTLIKVDTNITPIVGERILSDTPSDVEVKIEKLRDVFLRGTGSFTNFQLVNDPETDVSDMNPVNDQMGSNNYTLFAGSVFIKPLIGQTP